MTGEADLSLGQRISRILALDPGAVAVEYEDQTVTWGDLADASRQIEALIADAGVARDLPVGWAARNRPTAVAAFVGLMEHERMVAPLRPDYAVATFREDIRAQRLAVVIGEAKDWAGEGVVEAAREVGSLGIQISGPPFTATLVPELSRPGPGPHRPPMPGYVLERLTSGTTGPPKRIPVPKEVLIPALRAGEQTSKAAGGELRLQRSPALLLKPFSHAGGLFGLLLSLYQARPIVLFERFKVEAWVAAVRKYRPKSANLVPTMIRMLMESDVNPEDLSSLLAMRTGTAPLEPEIQSAFEARFGIPILIDYGAAEFIGGLAGWTIDEHRAFGQAKRGSVGRARRDVQIRAAHPDTGAPQPAGEIGLIEIKGERYGPDWIRTNDLALIDSDGFIFLKGRADDAINRGGFKILPEEVAAVLRQHPAVGDAAVIGAPDPRLGAVPIAAIELPPGGVAPDSASLDAFVRERLPAYMAPVAYHVVAALPRTSSMKVARPELRALLGI